LGRGSLEVVACGEIDSSTDWSMLLDNVDCVIHCAARAHVMRETERDALSAYRRVNVEGTSRLAEQAASAGVRRMIFLSTIKVNGERTVDADGGSTSTITHAFNYNDPPSPEDPYGLSKWEAEQSLWQISEATGLDTVIVRPPLVCGPGVKGNLSRLIKLVKLGVPLPLARVENKRSLICLSNLTDFITLCIDHPEASGKTFLVSDTKDFSTPALFRLIAEVMNAKARLFPFPLVLLRAAAVLFGKQHELDRLLGSLRVDSSYARNTLGWVPPTRTEDGIREMVEQSS
jgi:nucleoside-diphosphate-sugar epimerase